MFDFVQFSSDIQNFVAMATSPQNVGKRIEIRDQETSH